MLHVETTSVSWALGLRKLIVPGEVMAVSAMPFDHARNHICQTAVQNEFSHVFMLDSDVVCPPDTILRLLAHRKPICGGVYFRRSPPLGVPVMMRRTHEGMLAWVTAFPANKIIEVDVMGSGCCLMSRELLEKVAQIGGQRPGKIWYDWRVDLQGTGLYPPGECLSEDYTLHSFIKRKLGIPILVDTSILCKHIGLAESKLNDQTGLPEFSPNFAS